MGGDRPDPVELSADNVAAWRLRRQHLDARAPAGSMLQVTADLCGVHAQVMSSAELTLWARVEALEATEVARALWEERTLVKTWGMRGTLHLLPAAEMPFWQAGFNSYRQYLRPVWLRTFGFTREELELMLAALSEALDDRLLTREELVQEVGRITGSPELGSRLQSSWGSALKPAAFRGLLCFAPSLGQKVRFTRPDTWVHGWQQVDPNAALRQVPRRFLGTYGPAQTAHFARWWGVDPAPAARLLRELDDELVEVKVAGVSSWMLAGDVREAAAAVLSHSVRLLPAFDQYVVGAPRDDSSLLAPAFKGRVYRPQAWLSPVLLVDGRMECVWRHEKGSGRLLVEIEPFGELASWVRPAAELEAERLSRFLGAPLKLRWGD